MPPSAPPTALVVGLAGALALLLAIARLRQPHKLPCTHAHQLRHITVRGKRLRMLCNDDMNIPEERPIVILLHGAGGQAEQWGEQYEHLKGDYRVLAVDLVGHGASEVTMRYIGMIGYTHNL